MLRNSIKCGYLNENESGTITIKYDIIKSRIILKCILIANLRAYGLYFLFSILALIQMKLDIRIACVPIVLLFIYVNLIYLPLHIEPRYGVKIYPGLCILTAIGL